MKRGSGLPSLVMRGLGRIYAGEKNRGAAIITGAMVAANLNVIILPLIAPANSNGPSGVAANVAVWRSHCWGARLFPSFPMPVSRRTRDISGRIKEDPNPPGHRYGAIGKAADFWARAALGDTFEQWRKAGGDKKQPWRGGKVYYTPLIHAPDNRRIADDPIKIGNSTEERFGFLDDIDVDDAKLILAVHGHQIDEAKRIAGNICINRAQALFEDRRAHVQKSQNRLSINCRRIVQQERSPGLSPFGWSLRRRDVGSFGLFSWFVGRLRQKQVGNILQSSGKPLFRSPVLLEGGLYHFHSLQVQVIETKRGSAKMGSNQRLFASNSIMESRDLGSTFH